LRGVYPPDPYHKHLPTDEAAQRQGANRLARGHFFFEAGLNRSRALGTSFGWSLQTVPGVGHNGGRMLRSCLAAGQLFPAHDAAPTRPPAGQGDLHKSGDEVTIKGLRQIRSRA